jgi:uncharacterized membrane protein YccC
MGPPDPLAFDPHVGNAILAIVIALVAAVFAFALGLPNNPPRRRRR